MKKGQAIAAFIVLAPVAYLALDVAYGQLVFRPENVNRVQVGMNSGEVEAIMGRPSSARNLPDGAVWTVYSHRWSWTYSVVVLDSCGKVSSAWLD